MTPTCHPVPHSIAQDMLGEIVYAIADRPGQTEAHREALARGVVHSVMAFEPRDAVEIMLAGVTVAHFHLILDSTHDALRGQVLHSQKLQTKSGIVALDRRMAGLMKELRDARVRPMDETAAARQAAPARPTAATPEREIVPPPPDIPAEADHNPVPNLAKMPDEGLDHAPAAARDVSDADSKPGDNREASASVADSRVPPAPCDGTSPEDLAALIRVPRAMTAATENVGQPEAVRLRSASAGAT